MRQHKKFHWKNSLLSFISLPTSRVSMFGVRLYGGRQCQRIHLIFSLLFADFPNPLVLLLSIFHSFWYGVRRYLCVCVCVSVYFYAIQWHTVSHFLFQYILFTNGTCWCDRVNKIYRGDKFNVSINAKEWNLKNNSSLKLLSLNTFTKLSIQNWILSGGSFILCRLLFIGSIFLFFYFLFCCCQMIMPQPFRFFFLSHSPNENYCA